MYCDRSLFITLSIWFLSRLLRRMQVYCSYRSLFIVLSMDATKIIDRWKYRIFFFKEWILFLAHFMSRKNIFSPIRLQARGRGYTKQILFLFRRKTKFYQFSFREINFTSFCRNGKFSSISTLFRKFREISWTKYSADSLARGRLSNVEKDVISSVIF